MSSCFISDNDFTRVLCKCSDFHRHYFNESIERCGLWKVVDDWYVRAPSSLEFGVSAIREMMVGWSECVLNMRLHLFPCWSGPTVDTPRGTKCVIFTT